MNISDWFDNQPFYFPLRNHNANLADLLAAKRPIP